MSQKPATSPESQVLAALRGAGEPLTLDQLLEHVPDSVSARTRNPRQWLRNAVLPRPEVGHVARGVYVYLPAHITGSTLRMPLTGVESQEARLWAPPELAFSLWFQSVEWQYLKHGVRATCELPDGRRSSLSCEGMLWSAVSVGPGDALLEWLRHERVAAGDSLLFHVQDAEARLCRVSMEKLAQRDRPRVSERNRRLADMAAAVLREARRPLSLLNLASWLLARDFYREACPPDPLLVALTLGDDRFTLSNDGEVALATKWDRLLERDEDLEALLEVMASSIPRSVRPSYDLQPWLDALDYAGEETAPAADVSEADEVAAWAGQVYQLRVALKHRKSLWRVFAIRGDQTLGELDNEIRRAFQHDSFDHLSQFYVRTGGRRGQEGLGEIYPGGGGPGAGLPLGELELSRGDELGYVYDFGDWIEHTITVEAVGAAEPGASYPREVARSAPRYRNCVACAARGKKVRATWICIDCSNERQENVFVCESCVGKEHDGHYIDEIVY